MYTHIHTKFIAGACQDSVGVGGKGMPCGTVFIGGGLTILYYTILYCTVLYYTTLYYTKLYYTILCYTITIPCSSEAASVVAEDSRWRFPES